MFVNPVILEDFTGSVVWMQKQRAKPSLASRGNKFLGGNKYENRMTRKNGISQAVSERIDLSKEKRGSRSLPHIHPYFVVYHHKRAVEKVTARNAVSVSR